MSGVTNPEFVFVCPKGVSILFPILVGNAETQNHYAASTRNGSVSDDEDPFDLFYMPPQTRHVVGALPDPVVDKLRTLEEKFKSFEVHTTPDLDVVNMFLVPKLVIP